MQIVTALGALTSDDVRQRLSAIETLEGNVHPAVRNGLAKLQRNAQDPEVLKKIGKVLESIESKLQIYRFIENMFFGLSLGSVLVLAAIGLAITFGVMGVINMAHGELIMIGAYTTYVIQLLLPDNIG
ncbi:MAG: urea ABC transporter permease subunit UrtB, partial [Gammaproteobacteria bacterium]|nr:urea ABC transporter permease subunit UrtB [Gammaproteobacteria bacterium]